MMSFRSAPALTQRFHQILGEAIGQNVPGALQLALQTLRQRRSELARLVLLNLCISDPSTILTAPCLSTTADWSYMSQTGEAAAPSTEPTVPAVARYYPWEEDPSRAYSASVCEANILSSFSELFIPERYPLKDPAKFTDFERKYPVDPYAISLTAIVSIRAQHCSALVRRLKTTRACGAFIRTAPTTWTQTLSSAGVTRSTSC